MKKLNVKKVVFVVAGVSLVINALLITISFSIKKDFIAIPKLEKDRGEYAAACIVTAPAGDVFNAGVTFGTISIVMEKGDTAYLQISTLADKHQSYTRLQYVCDREVVSVSNDRFRTAITALATGETLLEAFDDQGGKIPVCLVTVK
ncbi:hypothetical protein FACS189485_15790 [Spirochaetia bacterium]|nr:hypothetical protein FACS189485_15790 [Spirochaetia bacterium]